MRGYSKAKVQAYLDTKKTPTTRGQLIDLIFKFGQDLLHRQLKVWENPKEIKELIKLRRVSQTSISKETYKEWSLSTDPYSEAEYRLMKEIIERRFYSEVHDSEHEIYFKHYASWWQHFKGSMFPKWLLDIMPVKWAEQKVTATHNHRIIYPSYDGISFVMEDWQVKASNEK